MWLLLLLFLNFVNFNYANLYSTNQCNNLDDVNSCINEYGCAWCNKSFVTEKNITFEIGCNVFEVCPLEFDKDSVECIYKESYSYNFNCMMVNIVVFTIIMCGFLLCNMCLFGSVYYVFIKNLDERNKIIFKNIFCLMILFLCIVGIVTSYTNNMIYFRYMFSLIIFSFIIMFLSSLILFRKKRHIRTYTLINNDEQMENSNPPDYGKI